MILITGNENKVKEFEEILGFKISHRSLDLEEIQGVDVEEISKYKAKKAYEVVKEPVVVEDIGLFFNELNGLPGALIKWFEKRLSYEQICNLIKEDRKAIAKIVVSYFDGKELKQFIGEVQGEIALSPRGENGFGWDKIFIPQGYDKTFAEMNTNEKHNISMRKIALEKLRINIYD
ncbi:MAG TPA: RdgB/HAM1 family non-canonical purine NTP pyrophosphatase [Candidatus Pacearchaeota archaeon]|nr:RdgB/HAM1 family non-canonical purine NTP pyrophosphatase [Candidatus Pacearchaeota archaeon]